MKNKALKNFVGLFIPIFKDKDSDKYATTMSIGGIPLGWIIVIICVITNIIINLI